MESDKWIFVLVGDKTLISASQVDFSCTFYNFAHFVIFVFSPFIGKREKRHNDGEDHDIMELKTLMLPTYDNDAHNSANALMLLLMHEMVSKTQISRAHKEKKD